IRKTDLIRSTTFSEITNSNLFLKLECLQKTGSFKVRGAMFKINNLSKDLKKQGVIAASAGNHAQAVAFASSIQNISCVIVMPKNSSPSKILATRSYGAKVILEGNSYDEAAEYVKEFAREENRRSEEHTSELQSRENLVCR